MLLSGDNWTFDIYYFALGLQNFHTGCAKKNVRRFLLCVCVFFFFCVCVCAASNKKRSTIVGLRKFDKRLSLFKANFETRTVGLLDQNIYPICQLCSLVRCSPAPI